jgi:tetratricopeptide (TPR) repeat protein
MCYILFLPDRGISYFSLYSLLLIAFTEAYLLQAEEQFCERNFDEAETLYDAAILCSKQHKFLNEEALANELAGYFYLDTGRKNRSVHYFMRAFEKYNEWGAVAKAASLSKYFE